MSYVPWWVLYIGGGLLLLVTTTFLLFTLYVAYIHWQYSHIPSPKMSSFFLGHIQDLRTMSKQRRNHYEPFSTMVAKWTVDVGDFFVLFFMHSPLIISSNPADVKRVASDESIDKSVSFIEPIITLYGQRFARESIIAIPDYNTWQPRRKIYDPAFKRSSLKEQLSMFNEAANTFLEKLRPLADGKTQVPMKEAFHEAALDTISKVAFSSDFSKTWDSKSLGLKYITNSKLSHLVTVSFKGIQRNFLYPIRALFPLFHPYETRVYREAVIAMRKIGRDCIEKRIKAVTNGEEVPNDILTQILQISNANKGADLESLVDDFIGFYVAGQETTANTLSFAIILIHQHPEVLNRLLSEIEDVLGDRKEVTGDDLDKLKYTEQVIQEVLRMYPPTDSVSKESPKGGIQLSGYHIPEHTNMLFYNSVLCRHAEQFENPDMFDPSRFDAGKSRPGPFVYFPFGIGHRSCIGRHFAMIEAKVILTRLLQSFKVTLPPSYKLVVVQLATIQPQDEVLCTLEYA